MMADMGRKRSKAVTTATRIRGAQMENRPVEGGDSHSLFQSIRSRFFRFGQQPDVAPSWPVCRIVCKSSQPSATLPALRATTRRSSLLRPAFPPSPYPMGFTHGTRPAGLTFRGTAPFTEHQLIRYANNTNKPHATTSRRYSSRRCRPPCIPLGGDPPRHEARCRSRTESCPHRCYVYGGACAIAARTRRATRH